jgi:Putative zinc dependent peptidase (DUF5700)
MAGSRIRKRRSFTSMPAFNRAMRTPSLRWRRMSCFMSCKGRFSRIGMRLWPPRPESSSPEMREMHNVHAALLNLAIEGMADYVGDPRALPGGGAGIVRARREYARNLARSGESFALFDTIIYRLYRDPDAPLESLLNLGFGGSWEQSGYYVGYAMASAIERNAGLEKLQQLVASPPEDFVLEYIAVEKRAGDRNVIRLVGSTAAAVLAARRSLTAGGAPAP